MRNIKQLNLAANVSPTMLTCKKKEKTIRMMAAVVNS